jgi:hypothetical protein
LSNVHSAISAAPDSFGGAYYGFQRIYKSPAKKIKMTRQEDQETKYYHIILLWHLHTSNCIAAGHNLILGGATNHGFG